MVLSVSQSTRDGSISLAARLSTSVAPCHDGESLITVFMAINPSPALARGALNSRLDGFSTQPLKKFLRPSSSSARGAITACEVFCMSNFPQYLVASPQFGTICWDRKGVIFPCRDKTRGNILALRIFRSVPATAASARGMGWRFVRVWFLPWEFRSSPCWRSRGSPCWRSRGWNAAPRPADRGVCKGDGRFAIGLTPVIAEGRSGQPRHRAGNGAEADSGEPSD